VRVPSQGLIAVAVGAFLISTAVASAAPSGEPHYPDLRTTRRFLARRLQIVHEGGAKLLRFSNNVRNDGAGPLEVRAQNDPVTDITYAYQRVYTHDPQGNWSVVSETQVGTFAFHESHDHWHLGDFASYALHDVGLRGGVGSVERVGSKVTFCVADSKLMDPSLEHAAGNAVYPASNCDQNNTQGISVGWGDTYKYTLPDQSLDITGVPDGEYWLVSTADPDDRLAETNEANNAAKLKVRITGDSVTKVT
jgi:hypothetical protein